MTWWVLMDLNDDWYERSVTPLEHEAASMRSEFGLVELRRAQSKGLRIYAKRGRRRPTLLPPLPKIPRGIEFFERTP